MSFLSRLSPVPSFPSYTGPHQVGTVDVEIPSADLNTSNTSPDGAAPTVAFRLFYPCDDHDKTARPVRWIPRPQKSVIASFAKFLGSNSWVADLFSRVPLFLTYVTIPAHRNAKVKKPQTSTNRWPVMVFSHGLAGSRNLYSHICGSLASYGVVVVAMDHRDGSSPIQYVRATKTTDEQIIGATKISHDPVKETYHARDKQLRIRIWEVALAYNALFRIDQGEPLDNLDLNNSTSKKERVEVLSVFRDMLDLHRPGKVTWAGHSFGAATTIQTVKSIYYGSKWPEDTGKPLFVPEPGFPIVEQITAASPLALLDLWGLPLSSPDTKWLARQPLPCYKSTKTDGRAVVGVLSSAFYAWTSNLEQVQQAVMPPAKYTGAEARLFCPHGSEHFSQSDVGILFPRLTAMFSKAQDPEYALELNTRAVLQMMRENEIEVADSTVTKDGGETHPTAQKTADDSAILADPESVPGWQGIDLRSGHQDDVKSRRPSPTLGAGDGQKTPEVVHDANGKVT